MEKAKLNSMCKRCAQLGTACGGDYGDLYSGCIYHLKEGDKVTLDILDMRGEPIKTRNYGKVFTVKQVNGKYGIDWNSEDSFNEEPFVPFDSFAWSYCKLRRV